jgi:hypothetical protein
MRFLQRHFQVATRYGGGFVQSIGGLSGGQQAGHPVDWFFYVNGSEAGQGAASTPLHPGDRVLWDRHDWRATIHIPAIVGSFPQPFQSGVAGKRLPVLVNCASLDDQACKLVKRRLAAVGVRVGASNIGSPAGQDVLRVLVGPWSQVGVDAAARQLDRGPAVSGVYARFSSTGLVVLDSGGRAAATLGAGTGLVAATRVASQQPTWLVTGTDAAGVLAAARHLDAADLAKRFALVVRGNTLTAAPKGGS